MGGSQYSGADADSRSNRVRRLTEKMYTKSINILDYEASLTLCLADHCAAMSGVCLLHGGLSSLTEWGKVSCFRCSAIFHLPSNFQLSTFSRSSSHLRAASPSTITQAQHTTPWLSTRSESGPMDTPSAQRHPVPPPNGKSPTPERK